MMKRITAIFLAVLLSAAMLTACSGDKSNSDSEPEIPKVPDGVYVNKTDLSGMTEEEAKAALTDIEKSLADGIKVEIKAQDNDYTLTKDDFTYRFNTDEIAKQVKSFIEDGSIDGDKQELSLTMEIDTSNVQEIADGIAEDLYIEPIDARVVEFDTSEDDMFTYQEGERGQQVDTEDLTAKICETLLADKPSGSIEAAVNEIDPDISEDYLRDHIVKLSSFSTTSTNNANGNENMRVSLKACDGSIIDPGETWSFNDHTGDSNLEENGYKPAGVINEGRTETGIGGGICQSSTTIYNATLLAGMLVVERCCHYYKSTYADAGRDATIDYGNIDLKMMNPFGYQLFMKCWMKGTELYCEIWGLENPDFDDVEISTSSPDYFDDGYTVEAWRTYYKNGEEVGSDDLPSSTYYTKAPDD